MESTKYYLGLDVGGTNMVAGVVDENPDYRKGEYTDTSRTHDRGDHHRHGGSQQKSGSQSRLANGRHLFLGHRHA